ncbi:MAG: class I SAM-dependent methyltransferase [Anaerolineales bacterium]
MTVFDNSPAQLKQDTLVAEREGLTLKTVEGDAADLSAFADESFDLIFNPCFNRFHAVMFKSGMERITSAFFVGFAGFVDRSHQPVHQRYLTQAVPDMAPVAQSSPIPDDQA